MTSFGRGRGILASKKAPTLPKDSYSPAVSLKEVEKISPGPTIGAYENANTSPDLHSFGEKLLSLGDKECLLPLVFGIINDETCTIETIERMVKIIIDRCMWLPSVSKKYADLLNIVSRHKIFGKDIRRFTFNSLQIFYEEKDDLWKSKRYGESTFRNAVTLTGEIYFRYRLESDVRLKFLGGPMLTYLQILVKSTDENDILTLTQQISWSGSEISKVNKMGYKELLLDVRHCIVDSANYTVKSKWMLLLCHELQFQDFENICNSLKTFYQKNLGGNILASICPPTLEIEKTLNSVYYQSISHFFFPYEGF